jgi:pyruvate,orthophosphate dikinase
MFMATERLPVMQEMVMSGTREEREQALDKLRVMQKEDFTGIFEAMEGLPVTIRLLDPPLHEFLPNEEDLREKMSKLEKEGKKDSSEYEKARATMKRALSLRENNPMLGFRGCRLGMIYPEIYDMQIRAILEAACELAAKGKKVIPDIMMPLVGTREEMKRLKEMVDKVATETMEKAEKHVDYLVGTMIELPRAALVADKIAEYAEFFSFGTNDLTQTTFGYSRDDAEGKFLAQYVTDHILDENPFHVLDREGVGRLMEIAVNDGRSARPDIQIGICGEHGGNPRSIAFCHKLKLKYVSCSPYRVPVARLSAAQAKLGLID